MNDRVAPVFIRLLLLLIPVSIALAWFQAAPLWIFVTAIGAIIPLSDYLRLGTEEASHHLGGAVGGLLNVTFGNAPELILAAFILRSGAVEVVRAQITGAFIGNGLLGLGLAIVVGSLGREKQTFKKESASMLSAMLMLCVVALLLPAMFDYAVRHGRHASEAQIRDDRLSLVVSGVLIAMYVGNLVYTLVTHRDIFAVEEPGEDEQGRGWSLPVSLGVLLGATALTAVESELVSGALEAAAHTLGLSLVFLGIVVLAVVGNIPEKVTAIYFARRDRMGLVMTITVGSTIQIALLVTPLLVFISRLTGHPMNLVFASPLEMISFVSVALVVNAIARDGETTWFEGVLLLGVYVILATAYFFVG